MRPPFYWNGVGAHKVSCDTFRRENAADLRFTSHDFRLLSIKDCGKLPPIEKLDCRSEVASRERKGASDTP
jgi:hypothetical protein